MYKKTAAIHTSVRIKMKKLKYLLLITALFSIIWLCCSKDFSPFKILHNDNRTEEWVFMGLNNKHSDRIRLFNSYLYVCAYDSGLFRINTNNNHAEWEFLGLTGLGTYSGINDVAVLNDTILVCYNNGIYRSIDNGRTWHLSNNGIGPYRFINTLAQSKDNRAIVFAGNCSGQIFISSNFGKSWKEVSYSQFMGGGWNIVFDTMCFHPNKSSEIWAGATSNGEYPILFKTKNLGKTWDIIMEWDQSPEGKYAWDYIYSIAFDPVQDSTVYVGMRRVWKSTTNGREWSEFFNIYPDSLSVSDYKALYFAIEINPKDSNEIWILEREGLYYTVDGGQHWDIRKPSEDFKNFESLAINWDKRVLYVSDYNRGIWEIYFDSSDFYLKWSG